MTELFSVCCCQNGWFLAPSSLPPASCCCCFSASATVLTWPLQCSFISWKHLVLLVCVVLFCCCFILFVFSWGLVGFKKKKYFGFLWFCLFCCLFVFMGEFSAGLVRGTGLWKKSQQSAELVRGRSMWLEKRDAGRTWVRSQTLPDRLQHHVGVILWLCSGWARWGEIDVSGSPCASCALWDLTGCTAAQLLQMGMVACASPILPYLQCVTAGGTFLQMGLGCFRQLQANDHVYLWGAETTW